MNYAACHDCTLVPETACEFSNVLLDRVSIVGTGEDRKLGIFGGIVQVKSRSISRFFYLLNFEKMVLVRSFIINSLDLQLII